MKLGKQHPSQYVTLTKQVKDLFDKNFKCLRKEFKDLRRWKDLAYSWISRINRKNDHLTKSNMQNQCNTHQDSKSILHRDRAIPKLIWTNKKRRIQELISII